MDIYSQEDSIEKGNIRKFLNNKLNTKKNISGRSHPKKDYDKKEYQANPEQ